MLSFQSPGLVLELASAKDRLCAAPVSADKVPTLADKALHDAMEGDPLVMQGFLRRLTDALFPCTERSEVFAGPGGIGVKELDDESPGDERRWYFGSGGTFRVLPARVCSVALEEVGVEFFRFARSIGDLPLGSFFLPSRRSLPGRPRRG